MLYYIKSPVLIQSFMLNRINEINILDYLTYDILQKGEYQNMLKLH